MMKSHQQRLVVSHCGRKHRQQGQGGWFSIAAIIGEHESFAIRVFDNDVIPRATKGTIFQQRERIAVAQRCFLLCFDIFDDRLKIGFGELAGAGMISLGHWTRLGRFPSHARIQVPWINA